MCHELLLPIHVTLTSTVYVKSKFIDEIVVDNDC